MCGIVGVFDFKGDPVALDRVRTMAGVIRHRGPDDEGAVQPAANVAIGSTRLSILDLTPAGHMPMLDEETGNWIVYNGEIYNYLELPPALGLGALRSRTDTEVLLKAYAKLGPKCLDHLNGIFAFAIWDAKRQALFCARDRLGVKPFLYVREDERLVFGSEAKSLLAWGIPARPNARALVAYLGRGVYEHGTETFFDGVLQLPPGHAMTVDRDGMRIFRYWDLTAADGVDDGDAGGEARLARAADEFKELATDAIRLQLRADVPVAVHTSGGLDSTLMMAAINRINGSQGLFKAFCHVYGEERYDERPYVENLTKQLGWSVEYHRLDAAEVPDLAVVAMAQQEQPFPGVVTLAKTKLIRDTRGHGAKVILEGQGGDEIGAGYQYQLGPRVLDLIEAGRPDAAMTEIEGFARLNGLDGQAALRKVMGGMAASFAPGRSADGSAGDNRDCLDAGFARGVADPVFETPFKSHLLNMQYRDIFHTKLPRILRSCDRASMAYGRELRVPLLDYRLVEFAFALPAACKTQGGEQRRFMRRAVKDLLPTGLAEMPKRAVVDPQRDWLKGPLKSWVADTIGSRSFRQRGIFDAAEVDAAFADYVAAERPENSVPVWQWLAVETWFRAFIDGGTAKRAVAS